MASECTVVVPLCNEEQTLPTLHIRLTATLKRMAIPYEIIYVDNGSTDRTPSLIAELNTQDSAVRGILLSRRFSTQAALCAGLEATNGRAVITIDGNLEDPPEVIPLLLDAWQTGYEVVWARRRRRRNIAHRAASAICRKFLGLVSEIPIPTDTGEMVLMDRRAIEELNALPERTRFLTGLRSWVGFRQTVLEYDHHPRLSNRTVPILSRQIRTVIEGLICFSNVPLRAITALGYCVTAAAAILLVSTLVEAEWVGFARRGSLILGTALAMLGGAQIVCLGIVGQYVSRIYSEVRGRPLYVVRERVGFTPHPRAVRNILQFLPSDSATHQEAATQRCVRQDLAQELSRIAP